VIVARPLQQDGYVLKGALCADPLDEQTKALAGIFDHERWARLEAFMALQQGLREEAGHMPCLATVNPTVNPNLYRLIQQLWHGAELWMSCG